MYAERKSVGKFTFTGIGWEIWEEVQPNVGYVHRFADPICRSCQSRLKNPSPRQLECENPRCGKYQKSINLADELSRMLQLAVNVWEGEQRRKDGRQFYNFDQELVPLAEGSDSDDKHWCTVKLLQTDKGKMVMIMLGRKGHDSKVQFFLKDELDQVTFDQVGDLNPKELLLAFKAQFSDGATSETKFRIEKK